jgi:hypothetical protein
LGEDINLLVVSNTSGEGPSNRPDTFNQIPTTAQLEERVSEHGQKPQHNPAFMHSATLAPTPEVMDTFANESHKARSSDSIDQDKMVALEARIRVAVWAVEMCLVPNIVVPKSFVFPSSSNIMEHNVP